jgi:hypothetical protein
LLEHEVRKSFENNIEIARGFAGLGSRQGPADVARYPGFLAMRQQSAANKVAVTNFDVPKVVGQVRYLDPVFVESECADFRRILTARVSRDRKAPPKTSLQKSPSRYSSACRAMAGKATRTSAWLTGNGISRTLSVNG